ncbi:MAG: hypothetical protein HN542_02975 [Flavobacteriales bacterium]|nr:hypothetical protein [Flavobacteriales bacterium]MBT3962717.1 hypothetical protein [Flavobacteriales bacterium]MBT6382599.1 hypothetical protein [Flavobacteriales bacterium]MBT7687332.1 hypothetical protein [Flavobacteriales bacterium]MBT7750123.1 hypothetical protein [Flavobacteriales bacterium]
MKSTKLVKNRGYKFLLFTLSLMIFGFVPSERIEKLSLDLSVRTLFQGKSVSATGTVYYKINGGLMVTKMHTPIDQVNIANATGEYRSFDVKTNSVTLMQGIDFSSKNSFIYSFLSGQTNDMGLSGLGYRITDTKIEEGIVVNTFSPPKNRQVLAEKVEVAYENYLPIFLGFFDAEGKPIQKTYYTNYQNVSFVKMPFTITEIDFITDQDSSITRRTYSNLLLNSKVNNEWLDFSIPENATILTPQNLNQISK